MAKIEPGGKKNDDKGTDQYINQHRLFIVANGHRFNNGNVKVRIYKTIILPVGLYGVKHGL
jgi:hypothetical protein